MSARVIRRFAAGTTALALAGLGLVGIGASAANAVTTVPDTPYYGGTYYLADANSTEDLAEDSYVIHWNQGLAAIPAPGDWANPVGVRPAAATQVYTFISPQGSEADRTTWNAYQLQSLLSGGLFLQNVSPLQVLTPGTGNPAGTLAVASTGGDYSLGWAYTNNNGLNVVDGGLYYVHIHVTAGTQTTATFTYERVEEEAAPLPSTTTTISSFPSSVQVGDDFSLTATVSETTATGTVEFFAGSTSLGTAGLSGGTATLATANIVTSGDKSITAVYSGDTAFAGSTSAPVTIHVTSVPVPTTLTVGATSADNKANHDVVLTADVLPAVAQGTVTFTGSVNGGSAVTLAGNVAVSAGHAEVTVGGMQAGDWTINAAFTGVDPYVNSTSSAAATLTLESSAKAADPDEQDVIVTIPEGTLTITTPYTAGNPLDLGNAVLDQATSTWNSDSDPLTPGYQKTVFTDASDADHAIQVLEARPGNPGWKAYVKSTNFVNGASQIPASYLGLTDVTKHAVTGSNIVLADVTPNDVPSLSDTTAQQFAKFVPTTDNETGSVLFSANIALSGVPSSVQPGLYRATLTFTAY
jgi:hypothetical protein